MCPRIEESTEDAEGGESGGDARADSDDGMLLSDEDLGETNARAPLHSVHEISERLQSLPQFQGVRFCELTGRDDDETKERVMAEFASGQTPVMVLAVAARTAGRSWCRRLSRTALPSSGST